jgi:hypothetical protein
LDNVSEELSVQKVNTDMMSRNFPNSVKMGPKIKETPRPENKPGIIELTGHEVSNKTTQRQPAMRFIT